MSTRAIVDVARVNLVKIFSATKAADREALGARITSWLNEHPTIEVLDAVVNLTSDHRFHCLSIVLFAAVS